MDLFTTNDGTVINYRTTGEGEAIVMLHTAFDNLTIFNDIESEFNDKYQVVLVDLRGHGYSDKKDYIHFAEYAEDIKQLLDYLYIDHCSFIGHEMGASIAATIAARNPDMVKSLTLINPTLLNDMFPGERLYRNYAEKIRNWDENDQQKFLDSHLYYSKRKAKKQLKHMSTTNDLLTKKERNAVKASFNDNRITDYLSQLDLPTLIIAGQHGERTTVVEAKEVGDYINNEVKFVVFDKSGLYPFSEEKEKFVTSVKHFLENNLVKEK